MFSCHFNEILFLRCVNSRRICCNYFRSSRPGGWSSRGQPVDQLHNAFRRQLQLAGAEDLNYFSNLAERPAFKDLLIGKSGQAKRTSLITIRLLENTLTAWNNVSPVCFAAAWASCGYISKEESVDMQAVSMALDPSGLHQAWDAHDLAPVRHVKVPCWQIQRADETWATMPSSIAPFDRSKFKCFFFT